MRKTKGVGVKLVRKVLADGTVKTYAYNRGEPKAKRPTTLDELIVQYRVSPGFRSAKENTKKIRLRAFNRIRGLGALAVTDIRRRHIMEVRDSLYDRPALANQVLGTLSALLTFARDREIVEHNVAHGVKPLETGSRARWSDEAVQYATTPGRLPEPLRRAVVLALYSGQRQGDCLAMPWSAYDGEGITLRQQKTDVDLWIHCHSTLKAELDACKREAQSVRILVNERGRPWPLGSNSFATTFWREARDHVALHGLTFHGLRHTAAHLLAEAGCSEFQIMAVTGHKSLATVSHYTKSARQRGLATAAILQMETAGKSPGKRLNK